MLNGYTEDSQTYLHSFKEPFEDVHSEVLNIFNTLTLPQHIFDNPVAKSYRESKYLLPLNTHAYHNLITYLESNDKAGGSVIIYLLSTYCEVRDTQRGPIDQFSFEAIISQAHSSNSEPELLEGIPGVFTGVSNKDLRDNNAILRLGMLPMEADLAQDVRAELEEEDREHPPASGTASLVEEFDRNIKREDSADGPTRSEIPLPPSRARDVVMEVQKIKENRDRFKIESRTGGVGPAISVCMFSFHNTLDT